MRHQTPVRGRGRSLFVTAKRVEEHTYLNVVVLHFTALFLFLHKCDKYNVDLRHEPHLRYLPWESTLNVLLFGSLRTTWCHLWITLSTVSLVLQMVCGVHKRVTFDLEQITATSISEEIVEECVAYSGWLTLWHSYNLRLAVLKSGCLRGSQLSAQYLGIAYDNMFILSLPVVKRGPQSLKLCSSYDPGCCWFLFFQFGNFPVVASGWVLLRKTRNTLHSDDGHKLFDSKRIEWNLARVNPDCEFNAATPNV